MLTAIEKFAWVPKRNGTPAYPIDCIDSSVAMRVSGSLPRVCLAKRQMHAKVSFLHNRGLGNAEKLSYLRFPGNPL